MDRPSQNPPAACRAGSSGPPSRPSFNTRDWLANLPNEELRFLDELDELGRSMEGAPELVDRD